MPYRIVFSTRAERQFRKLDRHVQMRLRRTIDALGVDPRPAGVKKLEGEKDLYRVRQGDHRIIYQIRDRVLLVLVVRIGHRKDVYRG